MFAFRLRPLSPTVQGLLSALLILLTTLGLYHFPARLFFDTGLHAVEPYGLAYVAAVALMTLLGGRRLGFVTLGLAAVGALFLLPPRSSLEVGDTLGWSELCGLVLLGTATVVGAEWLTLDRQGAGRQPLRARRVVTTQGEVPAAADTGRTGEGLRELTEWWDEIDGSSRSWLLLGKGPSFERRGEHDLSPYSTIAINHVVREMPVFATSAVNYDVIADCADAIYANSRYLLMPRYPHSVQGEADQPLEALFAKYPVLAALNREGRLVWYNLSSDPVQPGSPIIQNAGFSVCILFNLLAEMGAGRVRTLGIDGGLAYASSFADIEARTRLANGMPSYDFQFADMMATVKRYGLDYAPLAPLPPLQRLQMLWATPASRKSLRRWLRRVPWRTRRTR